MAQELFSLFKNGQISYSSFSNMAENIPTPLLLTLKSSRLPFSPFSPTILASLCRLMLSLKVSFCWLTTQTLTYSSRLSLRKAVCCLELRQGGLSQRCEVLMLMKTWLLFCAHLITGYRTDSPKISYLCSSPSRRISSSSALISCFSYFLSRLALSFEISYISPPCKISRKHDKTCPASTLSGMPVLI